MVVGSFRPRRKWGFVVAWLVGGFFWMFGWFAGLGSLLDEIANLPESLVDVIFLGVWLLLWTCGAVWIVAGFMYYVAGRQTVSLTHDALTIRRAVGPIGWTKRYARDGVSELRTEPVDDGDEHEVVFAHGDDTVRFGEGLDQVAAENVVLSLKALL